MFLLVIWHAGSDSNRSSAHGAGVENQPGHRLNRTDYIKPVPANTSMCRMILPFHVLMTTNDNSINLRKLFKLKYWASKFKHCNRNITLQQYISRNKAMDLFVAEISELDDAEAEAVQHPGLIGNHETIDGGQENLRRFFETLSWFSSDNNDWFFDESLTGDDDAPRRNFGIWILHPILNRWIQVLTTLGKTMGGMSTHPANYNFFCEHNNNVDEKLMTMKISEMLEVLRTFNDDAWNDIHFEVYLANCSPVGEHKKQKAARVQRLDNRWQRRSHPDSYEGPNYWAEHFFISKERIRLFHAGHQNFRHKVNIDTTALNAHAESVNLIQAIGLWRRQSPDFPIIGATGGGATHTMSAMDKEERQELYTCIAAYLRYFRAPNPNGSIRRAFLYNNNPQGLSSLWDGITMRDMCYFLTHISYPFGINVPRRYKEQGWGGILNTGSVVKGVAQITRKQAVGSDRKNLRETQDRNGSWYVETLSKRIFQLITIEWKAGQRAVQLLQQSGGNLQAQQNLGENMGHNQYRLVRNPNTILQAQTCMNMILSIFGGEGDDTKISTKLSSGFPTYLKHLRNNAEPPQKVNADADNATDRHYWYGNFVRPFKDELWINGASMHLNQTVNGIQLGAKVANSRNLFGGAKTRKRKRRRKKTKRKNRKKGTKRRKKTRVRRQRKRTKKN